ncbi:hypothetical protein ABKV19_007399 [Rosa sericea]
MAIFSPFMTFNRISLSLITKGPFPNKKAAKCSHYNLKVVEIIRFAGTKRQIELVKYVTKTAIKLEKIVFNSVRHGLTGVTIQELTD